MPLPQGLIAAPFPFTTPSTHDVSISRFPKMEDGFSNSTIAVNFHDSTCSLKDRKKNTIQL